ncbi:hypothetical protein ACF1AO_30030 [Streptomyces longwoodensis]|uniref:DinB/UmuC family translesion DNA polymerase n=1 Tax=Streptomyces longwoodensis TaxID=68231 RepID=UPI0037028974
MASTRGPGFRVSGSISANRRFGYDELDAVQHRRVLLALAVELGARLCAAGQIAEAVSVTVSYAQRLRACPFFQPGPCCAAFGTRS